MTDRHETITLIDDEGNEIEFEVIATFDIEEREYAVLLPVNEEEDEAYILKIEYDEDGNMILVNIEDKSEFDDAAAVYEAIIDEII
ncbi:DUF1292 domain-containing protein [Caloranaerobacter azorensis]|uniref:UPF0473 protein SAMN02745135_00361 n=2 Tax=Caloranaerobacter azorensis TaxID=116090 RepID=A0A1M5RV29_9FIRM|nr:DUF1292 domain-containing protein [Caloranaerobacter azorensis]QIB26488.1 DUF1292 domain-containing protein [Caloranaerobacter azorensis]SHH30096.1 Protein of unknown function [Caloranaerobacter azorensis DSM 13643]